MHTSPTGLNYIGLLQKSLMLIGFVLFVVVIVVTAAATGSQDAAFDTTNPQPEIQAMAGVTRLAK